MAKLVFVILLLGGHLSAQAGVEIYASMPFGNSKMSDSQGSVTNTHSSTIFDFALGFGIRPMLSLGRVSLGVVGEWAWLGHSLSISKSDATPGSSYRFERNRIIAGAAFAYDFSGHGLGLHLEYYPYANGPVIYSDEGSTNPFRKNDQLAGTGFSGGIFWQIGGTRITALWRRMTINKADMNSVSHSLPDSQYSTYVSDEMTGTFGYVF